MKKIFRSLGVVFLIIILCSGCSFRKNNDKVGLEASDENITTYINLSIEEVDSKIVNGENFILFVYKNGCGNCTRFKPIVENAVKERNLMIYALESGEIPYEHELRVIKYVPAIVIFEEGEIFFRTDPMENEEYFGSNAGFLALLDKYIYVVDNFGDENIDN